ncbi:MAG: proton-conducting transporter membrane subunit, partial [Allobranchiibius sp.]
MTVGNVMALRESGALRFLAWSTVAQAGWIVLPFTTASTDSARRSAQYLAVYVLATVVVFAVVTAIAHAEGRQHVTRLSSYGGLLRRHPFLGGSLVLALLTYAGLPPAIAGLSAKIVALQPIATNRLWLLAVLAAVNAMLGVAAYLRWIRIMLGASIDTEDPDRIHSVHTAVVVVSVLALIAVSVLPQTVFGLFA